MFNRCGADFVGFVLLVDDVALGAVPVVLCRGCDTWVPGCHNSIANAAETGLFLLIKHAEPSLIVCKLLCDQPPRATLVLHFSTIKTRVSTPST